MVTQDKITKTINEIIGQELLDKAEQKDDRANGVQISGSQKVDKIALGVTCNEAFLTEAVESGAQYCIFHHGIDTQAYKSRYSVSAQKQLKVIFDNNLTIAAYHYALDAHPKIGNNAVIIRELGAKIVQPLFDDWGFVAKFDNPQDVEKLSQKCSKLFEHDVFAVLNGPKKVKTIGIVSGGAKPYAQNLFEMQSKGVELFISGETSEWVPHRMHESEINYFVCGHYATEVFGVQELGKVLKAKLKDKVEVEFIDIPNPI